jgi:diketogulonate reductase-like aldo/keto reductase
MTVPQEAADLPHGRMPLLGFGTWQIKGSKARDSVGWALDAGYRHLDTATIYRNEKEVGAGLAASGVPRDDVFVTTKCPPSNAGKELATLRTSLDLLGTDRVDLWLIHWPGGHAADVGVWRAFAEAREQGLARDIGVSNYSVGQIDELTRETGVTPAVNQVEWSPLLFDRAVLDGHRERGVALEGYSALRGGTLEHPTIVAIADRVGRTPAQVIIGWHLQHRVVVIPKSVQQERIRSNADVGDLTLGDDDMAAIDALGNG